MASIKRATSVDSDTPPDSARTPNGTDALAILTQNNKAIAELKMRVAELEGIVGQQREEEKQPAKSTLVKRVQFLENQDFSRKQLIRIRKTLQELTIYFASKSAAPHNLPDYHRDIGTIIDALNSNQDFKLRIQGHSNSHLLGVKVDTARSKARAKTVQDSLIHAFASQPAKQPQIRDRLTTESKGHTMPVAKGDSPENCRVTFVVEDYVPNQDLAPSPDQLSVQHDAISTVSLGVDTRTSGQVN